MDTLTVLKIVVTPSVDGKAEYVQISSPGSTPVNVVLIADKIEIEDYRP